MNMNSTKKKEISSKYNDRLMTKSRSEFEIWAEELDIVEPIESELDVYLKETRHKCTDLDFNILDW